MRTFSLSGRRHRDSPTRTHEATDFMDSAVVLSELGGRGLWRGSSASAASTSASASTGQGVGRHSLEDVISGGHRWLVFPKPFEAAFQADTAAGRRSMLLLCAVVGMVAFWLGSMSDDRLLSDLNPLPSQARAAIMVVMLLSLGGVFLIPRSSRRSWHYEGLTFFNTMLVNGSLVAIGSLSQLTTAFTHTQAAVLVVMYAGLAARQRFWWTFGSAALTLLAYVALVKGHTPLQALIVCQNIKLMVVAFAFTLGPNYAFEYGERRAWLMRQLDARRRAALEEAGERLRLLSQRDPLTGLYNRRQFESVLRQAWHEAHESRAPLAALMVDVDHFKLYNDTHGHPAGDACLERVAGVLEDLARSESGVAARLGGEEFALLLPGRTAAQAAAVGEALCQAVRALQVEHLASPVASRLTVSVGVASAMALDATALPDVMAGADQALYGAKASGRDRVAVGEVTGIWQPGLAAGVASPESLAGPMPALSSQNLEKVLAAGYPWQRFPAHVEAEYQSHRAPQRRRHLLLMAWLGLFCINVYAFSSRAMFPDTPDEVMWSLLVVSAGLLLLSPLLLAPLPGWLREMLYAEGICIMAVAAVYSISHSAELPAYSFLTALLFLPLFAGVVGRQSLACTASTVVVTLGAMFIFLRPEGAEQVLVLHDTIFIVATACVFTLLAACTLERGARKQWLLGEMERLDRTALKATTRRLHELSMQDPLTGLSNRRRFEADFARVWSQARQEGTRLSLLIIDVDQFKLFNDAYGHPAGDACLQRIAQILNGVARAQQGFSARLGGEEFAVILPGQVADQARLVGEQICAAVRDAGIEHRHSRTAGCVTVSAGVACAGLTVNDARQLLAAADDAVYAAKTAGRDRVAVQGFI